MSALTALWLVVGGIMVGRYIVPKRSAPRLTLDSSVHIKKTESGLPSHGISGVLQR